MTRAFTKRPVWAWVCDSCGFEAELAREQSGLPDSEQMESEGWRIAKVFGDQCPKCKSESDDTRKQEE